VSADFEQWFAELHVLGSFHGSGAARDAGLVVGDAWDAGDPAAPGSTILRKSGGYSIPSRRSGSEHLEPHLDDIIKQLQDPGVRLDRVMNAARVEFVFYLTFGGGGTPDAWIRPDQLAFIAALGAEVTFEISWDPEAAIATA
jgi:hypothetical protein